jgi:hypothetical protein
MPFDAAREAPALGQMTIDLPAAPGRRARTATLQLRACRVELARPRRSAAEAARLPASVTLTPLDAREIEPPRGRRAGALGAADPCPRPEGHIRWTAWSRLASSPAITATVG